MANQKHLKILKQGFDVWNEWRKDNPRITPDLSNSDLTDANLQGVDLRNADLRGALLERTDLQNADLSDAYCLASKLFDTKLNNANLSNANFSGAHFSGAILYNANLTGVNLYATSLINTNLEKTNLTNCRVFGIATWKLNLENAIQKNIIISDRNEPTITVDNLEVAQFIYLLLNNEKIRDVIDTITSKVVLILGRFTNKRKITLDDIREKLRRYDYVPVLFDTEKPSNRDFTETVKILALLARFIIADITEPKSVPQELQAIIPTTKVPVQPLIQSGESPYALFEDFSSYSWVLPKYEFDNIYGLMESFKENIIDPAEAKAKELQKG